MSYFWTTHKLFSFSPGKPFRRYQRSLTDSAFIFCKAEESAASSPRSSPLVSPFSRPPHSPFYRTTSPPTSPDFRPVTSPQRPKAPVTPPTPPVHPGPAFSALSSVPQTDNQVQAVVEPRAPSPAEPSAPPASPTTFVSLSPTLVKNNPTQLHSEALAASPQNALTHRVHTAFCFEADLPPQAPTAPLPERPQPNTGRVGINKWLDWDLLQQCLSFSKLTFRKCFILTRTTQYMFLCLVTNVTDENLDHKLQ